MTILAHGIGTRSDLPVPVGLAAAAAAAALVISFAMLAVLWRRPRRGGDGRPLSAATVLFDAPVLRGAMRLVVLCLAVVVVVVGLVGPADPAANIAPWAFYVTFWVGLVPASLLLGPVWRVLNPLRLVQEGAARLLRIDVEHGAVPLPAWVGYWPAAASLAVFAWFELVFPARAEPVAVAVFLLGYGVVHLVAGVVFGRRWFDRCDGFEVYSTLVGALAPLGRGGGGRLVLRNPLDGLAAVPLGPGLIGVVVALVGSTAYDGLSRTQWWAWTVPSGPWAATAGLVVAFVLIGVVFGLGTFTVASSGACSGVGPVAFAPTLAPIAAGYAVAHYFSLLIFDGQQTVILASDPMGTGADLIGTAGGAIDYTVLGAGAIALVQLGGIVVGHLLAAISAHDQAHRLFPPAEAVRTQVPMLGAMVALTVGAVGLVFAA